jgi:hypothetical protein
MCWNLAVHLKPGLIKPNVDMRVILELIGSLNLAIVPLRSPNLTCCHLDLHT